MDAALGFLGEGKPVKVACPPPQELFTPGDSNLQSPATHPSTGSMGGREIDLTLSVDAERR